jgi:hypothetical protein
MQVFFPTIQGESPQSGSGLPDLFNWKPPNTREIQIQIKIPRSLGLHWYADWFDRYPDRFDR